jgi:hypothetical protein
MEQDVPYPLAKVGVAGSNPVVRSQEGPEGPSFVPRVDLRSHVQLGRSGGVAEWLGKGLQNPLHRFNSGPRLGSAVPCRTSGA